MPSEQRREGRGGAGGRPSEAPFRTGSGAEDSFADLLRDVASAPPVRPEELAVSAARSNLVGRTVGRFRVLERLGAGGMGVVYGAEDTRLGRNVALKVLAPSSASDARGLELLLREARAAAAINHANVAAIYEVGEAEGIAFIAMEYVEGVTLRSLVSPASRGPLPLPIEDVLRYARQIAEGLAKAHARGVVHRDLKPDNVMIDRDDRIKILDFGLARPTSEDASQRGAQPRAAVAGTPMYMSPEQARGESVDARSDVFSFGVVLYEMLAGRPPFAGRKGDPAGWTFVPEVAVEASREGAPRALFAVIDRCLSARPEERYAGGEALARALDLVEESKARAGRSRLPLLVAGVAVGIGASLAAVIALRAARGGDRSAHGASISAPSPAVPAPSLARLTANVPENPILSAALSPDGETLAYIDKTGLFLERVGGPAERLVLALPGAPQIIAWFPDGQRLAVCTALPRAEDEELWVVPRSGSAPPKRLAHGPFTGLAVSPDGTRVAFAANDSVGWVPAGERAEEPKELRRLVRKSEGCFISDVAWSPDGGRIAYASLCFDSLDGTAIETVAAEGGPPMVAVADPHLYNSFVRAGVIWPKPGEIVYPRAEWLPAEAGSNLWSVPVDPHTGAPSAPPRQLTSWVGVGAAALTASVSTKRIAFIRFEAQTDVYVGALSNGGRALSTPERLTMTDRNERPSAWSKDGRGVYFFSDRSGNFDIFYQALDGGSARAVASGPEWETISQVSPDGESLLYWRFPAVLAGEAVRPELVRRPVAGGEPIPILTASSLAHPAGAGRPAPWEVRVRCPMLAGVPCVLSEKVGAALVFSALDPVRGRGEEVFRVDHPTAASNIWDISPDGTRLAIPRADGPISIESIGAGAHGAPASLAVAGCDPVTPAWSADGRGLFVSVDCEADAPPFRLYYVGLEGSASLLWQAPPLYILESEPSPDGKHLAIAVKHKDNDVWMIDGVR